jgi:hypothetical protein
MKELSGIILSLAQFFVYDKGKKFNMENETFYHGFCNFLDKPKPLLMPLDVLY